MFSFGFRVVTDHGVICCWSICVLIVIWFSGVFCIVYGVVFYHGRYIIVAIIILSLAVINSCRCRECRCFVWRIRAVVGN